MKIRLWSFPAVWWFWYSGELLVPHKCFQKQVFIESYVPEIIHLNTRCDVTNIPPTTHINRDKKILSNKVNSPVTIPVEFKSNKSNLRLVHKQVEAKARHYPSLCPVIYVQSFTNLS